MLVHNAFDLVDDHSAKPHQSLAKVGKLPDLDIRRIGRSNAFDTIGTLSALESFPVVPKECAKGICIAFIGLVHGTVIGLNDYDFITLVLFEFCEQPARYSEMPEVTVLFETL